MLIFALLGLALVLRLGVVAVITGVDETLGADDVRYHSQLVHHPVSHLLGDAPEVEQYAPYLGFVEWLTAKPWLAVGVDVETALRLSSVTWDLIAMAILLCGLARVLSRAVLVVGLVWALSPLVWPASAIAGQDETIAAAIVATAVVLLMTRRRSAAVAVLVLGLFVAKILLAPILAAALLTSPRESRWRDVTTALLTTAGAIGLTFALSQTDGLSQQMGYSTNDIGYSMTPWAAVSLHDVIAPDTAIRLSVGLTVGAMAAVVGVWFWHRDDGAEGVYRLAAALMFAMFAVLAVSNPEYLCIAAPAALVAGLGVDGVRVPWRIIVLATLAWSVNAVYHLLPKALNEQGSVVLEGFDGDLSTRVRLLDTLHQALLVAVFVALLASAWHFAVGRAPVVEGDSAGAEGSGGRGRRLRLLQTRERESVE
jgi:hypothetical protein